MRAWVVCADPGGRRLFDGIPGVTVASPEDRPDPEAGVWVAWGAVPLPPAPSFVRVVNRPVATALLADRLAVRERLRLAGLEPISLQTARAVAGARLFRVSLFDLRPYAVEVLDGGRGRWRPLRPDEVGPRTRERAEGAAIRALNALRLDAGRVTLMVAGADRLEGVCRLELAPRPPRPAAEALRAFVERWLGEPVFVHPDVSTAGRAVLLGADPEFLLVDRRTGEPVPASRFLPRAGSAGCDGHAGAPGQYPVAELRPAPAADPRALVRALRRCLLAAQARIPDPDLAWVAGSEPVPGLPIGGHIHISGVPLSGPALRALDAYLALPLLFLEVRESAVRRRRRHGFLGDVRLKRHGGFEYRTLPSWLAGPRLALGVLSLARLVAIECRRLARDPFIDLVRMRAFNAADAARLRDLLPGMRAELEQLPGYGDVRAEVGPLLDQVMEGRPWDEAADLRQRWDVGEAPRKQRQRVAVS